MAVFIYMLNTYYVDSECRLSTIFQWCVICRLSTHRCDRMITSHKNYSVWKWNAEIFQKLYTCIVVCWLNIILNDFSMIIISAYCSLFSCTGLRIQSGVEIKKTLLNSQWQYKRSQIYFRCFSIFDVITIWLYSDAIGNSFHSKIN